MEIKTLEDKGNLLKLEIHGVDHTIMSPLVEELSKNKKLKLATYSMPHPLLEGFVLSIEGDKGVSAKEALEKAVNGIKSDSKAMRDAWKKAK